MALQWNPASTSDYTPEMLQGGVGNWTLQEVQQLQQRGISMQDLGQLGLLGPGQTANPNAVLLRQLLKNTGGTGAQAPAPATAPGSSYFTQMPAIQQGGAWQPSGGGGAQAVSAPGATGAPGAQGGGGGTSMATTTAEQIPTSVSIPEWQQWYGRNVGKTMLVNGQPVTIGVDVDPNQLLSAFQKGNVGWGAAPGPQAPAQSIGGPGQPQPESVALQQMAQIDPTGEALRQGLGQSYLSQLQNVPQAPAFGLDLSRGAAAPAAGDVQSYLNLYKKIDPQGFAQRVALAGGMDKFVQQAQAQAALGSQLDPGTIREVEQGTRRAQIGRGNVYGTPQLVEEAMQRGSAGEARRQQRQAALGSALGQQQSYLGAGLGLGDIANTLYNQGYNRYLQGYGGALSGFSAQQAARTGAQQQALSYLGSGQTPYQAGAGYLATAENRAGMAAQGGPQYAPQGPSPYYTGAGTSSFPQYGIDTSQTAANWYNLMNAYNQPGAPQKNRAMGAGVGALGGAASGALAGAAAGGVGAIPGAIIGGIGGAASGYFA